MSRIGLGLSIVLFGIPALLLWMVTRFLVPALVGLQWEPLLAWFVGGGLIFALLLAAALFGAVALLRARSWRDLMKVLRVRQLSVHDWLLTAYVFVMVTLAMAAMHLINTIIGPGLAPHPPFMMVKPLAAAQYYILVLWVPFFFLNIVGEELWWRGFIQPRQEPVFGRGTWIVQGLLHGAFHFSFGLGVLFVLWPVVFAIPWAVQRTANTSVGMALHGGVNGPGFLAVTLGLLPT